MGVVSHDRTACADRMAIHQLGQKTHRYARTHERSELQLKQICRRNRDGSFTTQRDRERLLEKRSPTSSMIWVTVI